MIAEMFLLGVISQTPRYMKSTSVGLSMQEAFREPVRIHVNDKDSAELLFKMMGGFEGVEAEQGGSQYDVLRTFALIIASYLLHRARCF